MRWIVTIWLLLVPLAAYANDEDKGRLTKFLEGTLSGAGREVQIDGFEGALSSHATIKSLVISDKNGPWLTLNGVELIWTRSALLRGAVEVEKLIAAEILMPRLPESEPASPSPEASGEFALPELPVSINIGEISAQKVVLGAPVIGVDATLSVLGSMSLLDGAGAVRLDLTRTDGQQGHIRLDGGYSNTDRVLAVDLSLQEAAGGIAATLMKLPGGPAVDLSVKGTGPIDTYTAQMGLATDNEQRLSGEFRTQLQPELNDEGAETGNSRVFEFDVIGDLAPLFAPEYQGFFGPNMSLTTVVRRPSDGRTRLDQLLLNTRSLQAAGEMTLAPSGLPEFLAFDITLEDPEGAQVVIPGAEDVSLGHGLLHARYDAARGDSWSLRGRLEEILHPTLTIAAINLDGAGTIRHLETPDLTAEVTLNAIGIAATDAEDATAADAIGPVARLVAKLDWKSGGSINIETLGLRTNRSDVTANARITGPMSSPSITGRANASIADLAFLEPVLNRPLRGKAQASLSGELAPVSGAFDIQLSATGSNVETGEKVVDSLTGEKVALTLSAARDAGGITLDQFRFRSDALRADASGSLKTGEGALKFDLGLDDINRITPDFKGPVTLTGTAQRIEQGWLADIDGTAPGKTTLAANLNLTGPDEGDAEITLEVGQVQAFFPALPGSGKATAKAVRTSGNWALDIDGTGSSGFELAVQGDIDDAFEALDLAIKGAAPLEAANIFLKPISVQGSAKFDLALKGAPKPGNLSGTIATSGTRVSLPQFKLALADLGANINLADNAASIALETNVASGGKVGVNGSVGLQDGFPGNLDITLDHTRLQYENLLETVLVGDIKINGPLTGGASISGLVELDSTEIKVSTSALGGATAIPEIRHRNASGAVTRTRSFAGAIKKEASTASGGGGTPFNLDLTIRADNKVFVRGLGLDAEFQGEFGLKGPTNAIVTSGEFDLSRGRLDFLTKRLEMTEGIIRLEGDFIPYLRMVAETETSSARFQIVLEGLATKPDLDINSVPDMPSEEALSQILFGESLADISAFQAAQLAGALATLNGGGTGIVGKLRKGIGVDNLDITTDEDGTAGVSAGKHLNDHIYTEIGVDGKGQSTISLNFDVNRSITLKGHVDSESNTGIGVFFKRDY